MIVQNHINVQGEFSNKTDNHTDLYNHRTERIVVQIKEWCLCNYSIIGSGGETHLASLCN